MRIDIITIFPSMFSPVLNESIIKRAQEKGKVEIYDLGWYNIISFSSKKIIFEIHGKKLKGVWMLLKFKGENWLFFKMKG